VAGKQNEKTQDQVTHLEKDNDDLLKPWSETAHFVTQFGCKSKEKKKSTTTWTPKWASPIIHALVLCLTWGPWRQATGNIQQIQVLGWDNWPLCWKERKSKTQQLYWKNSPVHAGDNYRRLSTPWQQELRLYRKCFLSHEEVHSISNLNKL